MDSPLASPSDLAPDSSTIIYVGYAASSLGILGSLYVIATYFVFFRRKSFGTSLIFWNAVNHLFLCIGLLPFWNVAEPIQCKVQGLFTILFGQGVYFWSLTFVFTFVCVFVLSISEARIQRYLWVFKGLSWLLPCGLFALSLGLDLIDPIGMTWCWISLDSIALQIVSFVPSCLVLGSLIVMFIVVYKRFGIGTLGLRWRLALYLVVFVVGQFFDLLYKLQLMIMRHPIYIFEFVHVVSAPIFGGFAIGVIFMLTEKEFLQLYGRVFCCGKCCLDEDTPSVRHELMLGYDRRTPLMKGDPPSENTFSDYDNSMTEGSAYASGSDRGSMKLDMDYDIDYPDG